MDFEALYKRRCGAMFQLAMRLLRDREQAADAVQEAFTKAYESRASFRGEADPGTWLYRIVYNACVERLRRRPAPAAAPETLALPDAEPGRPEPAAMRAEAKLQLREALARLNEEDRRLLVLLMERELSYRELAAVLDCPEEPLRMRVCRARRRLREILEPVLGEET